MATAGSFARGGDLAGAGADLLSRYVEQHRRYHGLAHLEYVLRHVDDLAAHALDAEVVRLAAWFHDAVYDPRADDNEHRSAELAEEVLAELRAEARVVDEVSRLVRLTAAHQPEAEDRNGAVLSDADLAILGSDERTYWGYREGVRAEYGHLDDQTFAAGRASALRRLLAHDPLFVTPSARTRWEPAARQNMTIELAAFA